MTVKLLELFQYNILLLLTDINVRILKGILLPVQVQFLVGKLLSVIPFLCGIARLSQIMPVTFPVDPVICQVLIVLLLLVLL